MARIAISYRREESCADAGRLYDWLATVFRRENVFMDVDAIEPGQDFVDAIEEAVSGCGALVAVVGPDRATVTGESGRRRLEDPLDFVRLEVSMALKRRIPVIPVPVEEARMPRPRSPGDPRGEPRVLSDQDVQRPAP